MLCTESIQWALVSFTHAQIDILTQVNVGLVPPLRVVFIELIVLLNKSGTQWNILVIWSLHSFKLLNKPTSDLLVLLERRHNFLITLHVVLYRFYLWNTTKRVNKLFEFWFLGFKSLVL
jgi:hypothetical protein